MKTTYDENTGILTAQFEPGTPLKKGTTFGFQIDYDTIEITPLKRKMGFYLAKYYLVNNYEVIYINGDGSVSRCMGTDSSIQSNFSFISSTPLNLEELAKGGGV